MKPSSGNHYKRRKEENETDIWRERDFSRTFLETFRRISLERTREPTSREFLLRESFVENFLKESLSRFYSLLHLHLNSVNFNIRSILQNRAEEYVSSIH